MCTHYAALSNFFCAQGYINNSFIVCSTVKAGGKRVAKKSLEETSTHGTPEKETKRSDKMRWVHSLHLQYRIHLPIIRLWTCLK